MEDKAEERDLKRMKFEAELEEKRSMYAWRNVIMRKGCKSMMMGYMTHMMSMISGGRIPSLPNSHQVQATFHHLWPLINVYLPSTLNLNHTLPILPSMMIFLSASLTARLHHCTLSTIANPIL